MLPKSCSHSRKLFYSSFLLLLCLSLGISQIQSDTDIRLDLSERKAVVERIESLLVDNYVFPEKGKESGAYILSQMQSGAYDHLSDAEAFAKQLTDDLYSINKDKHMRVRFRRPDQVGLEREDSHLAVMKRSRRIARENFGFHKVEILDGNIGYVDFRYFAPVEAARSVATSAMHFIENTDAVIFDMRKNGGGNPAMVQYVCSYFFDKRMHLNSLYWRRGDRTQEFWTLDNVDGRKRPDVPVFILTSRRTFSGAEEFCYNFQTRERAMLIGETTGGGANPGGTFPINEHFRIFIPTGRAINPVTGTNWEGVGVKPDIETDADSALETALEKAGVAAEAFREKELERMKAVTDGIQKAAELFSEGKDEPAENQINDALQTAMNDRFADEMMINGLGYEFLGNEDFKMAIAVFRFNAAQFPESSNVYDSLGEAYKESGNQELAVKNYKKSLELDPGNENAKQMLAELGVE